MTSPPFALPAAAALLLAGCLQSAGEGKGTSTASASAGGASPAGSSGATGSSGGTTTAAGSTGGAAGSVAPFHVLASEGEVHVNGDHVWHMTTLVRLASPDEPCFVATPFRVVDITDPRSEGDAIAWWTELTGRGGEGMVVKPLDFIAMGRRGVVQPAVKCRGPEYLRIIYGPEFTLPGHLDRLRSRGLSAKRSLAAREFALGVEGLERSVRREPLRRVHECVAGVLAMESEPVDPRL